MNNLKKKKITITIPEGIDTGNNLHVRGQGHEGDAGAGDLIVLIYVEPHEIFKEMGMMFLWKRRFHLVKLHLEAK